MFVYKAIELQYFVYSCDKQHIFIKKKKIYLSIQVI